MSERPILWGPVEKPVLAHARADGKAGDLIPVELTAEGLAWWVEQEQGRLLLETLAEPFYHPDAGRVLAGSYGAT